MQVYVNNINEGNNQETQGYMEMKLKTTTHEIHRTTTDNETQETVTVVVAATLGGSVRAAQTHKIVVAFTESIADGERTSESTGLGTTGLEGTGTNISGGSATLDASLIRHEMDPVAEMVLASESSGEQSN